MLGLLGTDSHSDTDALAILAPGRTGLSYARLREHVAATVRSLNAMGIGRNDRVAVVLPNGPEMAVAFLAVATAATCAPLNPTLPASELEFYLSDLEARAVITSKTHPVRDVARTLGIAVIELVSTEREAGLFRLGGPALPAAAARGGPAEADDVALVLHTSGTTSRPKQVPLTHRNLEASARHIVAALALEPRDRCLNIMPLFHIHGLIGALLSSLAAGASIACTPGFVATDVFAWMEECAPTWYTAVPTMHHSIVSRTADATHRPRLRFVRSSSAALPTRVAAELEAYFGCPVIEAYGMTEASHQMASNPLPPRARKPGSVGVPAGPSVAIMAADGSLAAAGESGEVVIRGPNVTRGYFNNDAANRDAFRDGWFRTGDQGHFDADGYLFLTGRLKEQINRGGEKISPLEVDEIVGGHPAVAQALTFAMPDPRLGEEVAVAIVLRPGASCDEAELKAFVAARLADFKVPKRVVVLAELPKGPTGKPQRIGLAQRLGVTSSRHDAARATYVAPSTPIERELAAVWEEVLRVERIGIADDFFQLGGDSILAARVIVRLRERIDVDLAPRAFFDAPVLGTLARVIAELLAPLLDEIEAMSDEEAERQLALAAKRERSEP